jgi:hypothetical protein
MVFITEVESVYSAVRAESVYKTLSFVFKGLITVSSFGVVEQLGTMTLLIAKIFGCR